MMMTIMMMLYAPIVLYKL